MYSTTIYIDQHTYRVTTKKNVTLAEEMLEKRGGITTCSTTSVLSRENRIVPGRPVPDLRHSLLEGTMLWTSGRMTHPLRSSLILLFFYVNFRCPLNFRHGIPFFLNTFLSRPKGPFEVSSLTVYLVLLARSFN